MVVRLSNIRPKRPNAFFVFFAGFRPYVGQPDTNIGWVTLMPFTSINPTNPKPIPLNFAKKYWELTVLKNIVILTFFFKKEKKNCLIPWKAVKGSWVARMGRKFDDYPGFQPMRFWANTYAQDCMKLLTWSVHFCVCLVIPYLETFSMTLPSC